MQDILDARLAHTVIHVGDVVARVRPHLSHISYMSYLSYVGAGVTRVRPHLLNRSCAVDMRRETLVVVVLDDRLRLVLEGAEALPDALGVVVGPAR